MGSRAHRWLWTAVAAVVALSHAAPARADDGEDASGWTYLVDGGALPFFWGSAAVAAGAFTLLSPPDEPLGFSASEGGATPRGDTIPNYQVAILAGATPLLLAIPPTAARGYHAKGAAEAIVTVAAVTELTKNIVGRHRPIYTAGSTDEDDRKSFFSGHASLTLAATTYSALYLHEHVFADWRDPDEAFALWEAAPMAGLLALSIYVPYTRIDDKRHHPSDIAVGAVVGTSTAIGFYLYQEHRFRASRRGHADDAPSVGIAPTANGVAVFGSW